MNNCCVIGLFLLSSQLGLAQSLGRGFTNLSTWPEGMSKAYVARPIIPHTSWSATVIAVDFSSWYTSRSEVTYTSMKGYLSAKAEWSGQSEWAVGWMGLQGGVSLNEDQRLHTMLNTVYIPFSNAFQLSVGLAHSIYARRWRMTTSIFTPLARDLITNTQLDFELSVRISEGWWVGNSASLSAQSHAYSIHLQSESELLSVRVDASWNGLMKAGVVLKTGIFDYSFGIQMGLEPHVQSYVGVNNHVEMD